MRKVGTSGFDGFLGNSVDEVAYYQGGHSDALQPMHHAALGDFVLGGEVREPLSLVERPGAMRQLSNLAPYLAIMLVGAMLIAIVSFLFRGPFGVGAGTGVVLGLLAVMYVFLDSM